MVLLVSLSKLTDQRITRVHRGLGGCAVLESQLANAPLEADQGVPHVRLVHLA